MNIIEQLKKINYTDNLQKHIPRNSILYNDIISKTPYLKTAPLRQRIWHILNNTKTPPLCATCKINYTKWNKKAYLINCSNICAAKNITRLKKIKRTNLKKYGVENPFQNEIIKEKIKKTNLDKYGVDNYSKTKECQEKFKKTNLDKYGVDNYSKTKECQEKIKKTNLDKYGVSNPFQNEEIKDKIKKNMLINHGVEHALQNKEIQDKMKKTMLINHGVEHALQNKEIQDKMKKTMLINHGVEHALQKRIPKEILKKLNNKDWLENELKEKTLISISEELNISPATLSKYCRKLNITLRNKSRSQAEQDVLEFCQNMYSSKIILNSKKIIAPYEIDLYFEQEQIGIEYNGLYWHSELCGKDKNYHINKTTLCLEKNIRLIHIFEHEWLYKQNIIKSRLNSILHNTFKIYGRKCTIASVSKADTKEFLNNNHMQGHIGFQYSYGLYYNNKLISIMTFGKPRFNKTHEYELLRFCTILNHTVVGGASKLYRHFIKTHSPQSIISYCDLRLGTGNVYKQIGMNFSHVTKPNYWYFNKNSMHVYSRIKFQKHKLKKLLPIFDENLTEWENMQNNGWNRFWDCGNSVWTYLK